MSDKTEIMLADLLAQFTSGSFDAEDKQVIYDWIERWAMPTLQAENERLRAENEQLRGLLHRAGGHLANAVGRLVAEEASD